MFVFPAFKTAYSRIISIIAVLCLLLSAASFSGCRDDQNINPAQNSVPSSSEKQDTASESDDVSSKAEQEFNFQPISVSDWTVDTPMPVYYSAAEYSVGEISVKRPVFIGENSARLNTSIRAAFNEYADEAAQASPVGLLEFEIAFSEQNLISIWMILRRPLQPEQVSGAYIETERKPFNYDVVLGKRINLQDAFGSNYNQSAAQELSYMIEEAASNQGYKLIGELDPIPQDQMFIFVLLNLTDSDDISSAYYGICFYFRQYELAVPSQGCPKVYIRIDSLKRFSASNSSVRRLAKAVVAAPAE